MAITFQTRDITFKLQKPSEIRSWIKKIIESEKRKQGQLNFVFTNDEELLKINEQYLKHSTYTDIITFDYCEKDIVHGDIIISIDRVKENAEKFHTGFEKELHRVMIHGVLHLCGYKDKTKSAAELMRKKEDSALKKLQ